jgi:alkylation response protein AidB-like acyl-CoA dehydrogenase
MNEILDAIDAWLRRRVEPHVAKLEHDDVYPEEMVEQMKELGLFGATIGQEYGGLGLSADVYARIVTRISQTWMSLTGIFNSHLMMALLVEKYGSANLKKQYLPRFASGQIRGGLALTEPNAGTDLQAIRTRAKKEKDAYVLNVT